MNMQFSNFQSVRNNVEVKWLNSGNQKGVVQDSWKMNEQPTPETNMTLRFQNYKS